MTAVVLVLVLLRIGASVDTSVEFDTVTADAAFDGLTGADGDEFHFLSLMGLMLDHCRGNLLIAVIGLVGGSRSHGRSGLL